MANISESQRLDDYASQRMVVASSNTVVVSKLIGTLTTAGAQHANDFVGTDHTMITFAGCARILGGTGLIIGAELVDGDLQSVAGELWLYDTLTALEAGADDNAAFTITDAVAKTCIAVIPFSTYYASALNSVSFGVPAFSIPFVCGSASKDLYGTFVTRGAPTYTTNVPYFRLFIIQD